MCAGRCFNWVGVWQTSKFSRLEILKASGRALLVVQVKAVGAKACPPADPCYAKPDRKSNNNSQLHQFYWRICRWQPFRHLRDLILESWEFGTAIPCMCTTHSPTEALLLPLGRAPGALPPVWDLWVPSHHDELQRRWHSPIKRSGSRIHIVHTCKDILYLADFFLSPTLAQASSPPERQYSDS